MTKNTGLTKKAQIQIADNLRSDQDASIAQLLADHLVVVTESTAPLPVRVPTLTDQHKKDLVALPSIFGKVAVTEPRALTEDELAALVVERDTIDRLLTILGKRKDETLRENLANHLDRLAEAEGIATEDTDAKGHYFVKQDLPVDGTGRKVQRIVAESKAVVDSAQLARLHEEGHLTREEYLALTVTPEVKRVFDPEKARKAILKDPALLEKLAAAVKEPRKTVTIKVSNDT